MKGLYVIFLVAVVAILAVSVNSADTLEGPQSSCPDICTFEYSPVCGYDGTCYQVYGNDCTLRSNRCKNKQNLKSVGMEKCEEAEAKTTKDVVLCSPE